EFSVVYTATLHAALPISLSAGSLYAMMAVGLALIFSILRLINFAHGDVMMVAVYLFVFAGFAGLPVPAALFVMVAGTILIGLAIDRKSTRLNSSHVKISY